MTGKDWEGLRNKMRTMPKHKQHYAVLLDQIPQEEIAPTFYHGSRLRLKFKLDEIEAKGTSISIVFPEKYVGYTPGFVEGMFGKSVERLETKKEFDEIYDIGGSQFARNIVNAMIADMYAEKQTKQQTQQGN